MQVRVHGVLRGEGLGLLAAFAKNFLAFCFFFMFTFCVCVRLVGRALSVVLWVFSGDSRPHLTRNESSETCLLSGRACD